MKWAKTSPGVFGWKLGIPEQKQGFWMKRCGNMDPEGVVTASGAESGGLFFIAHGLGERQWSSW